METNKGQRIVMSSKISDIREFKYKIFQFIKINKIVATVTNKKRL